VHSVAWNCIGTKLASGSIDHTARVWSIDPHGHVIISPCWIIATGRTLLVMEPDNHFFLSPLNAYTFLCKEYVWLWISPISYNASTELWSNSLQELFIPVLGMAQNRSTLMRADILVIVDTHYTPLSENYLLSFQKCEIVHGCSSFYIMCTFSKYDFLWPVKKGNSMAFSFTIRLYPVFFI
jgi:hypothetical protein